MKYFIYAIISSKNLKFNFVVVNKLMMKAANLNFNSILEAIYSLSVEDRIEIKQLLEHNIADSRRDEIFSNYKETLNQEKRGELKFSSSISDLKNIL